MAVSGAARYFFDVVIARPIFIPTGRSVTASAVAGMNVRVMAHGQIWLAYGKNVFDERYIQLSICMAYQPI